MKLWHLGLAIVLPVIAPAEPLIESTLTEPLMDRSITMDRLQRNELERAKAELNVEKLQAEMQKLQTERDDLVSKRNNLETEVRNLQDRLAALGRPELIPGVTLISLVPTTMTVQGKPARRVDPLTVVTFLGLAEKGSGIRVRWGGAEAEADAADFAEERDLVARLNRRVQFAEDQIRMAPDEPDGPAADRIERYEIQIDRARATIEQVGRAVRSARAKAAPAKP
jgi:FtsZ-binding cell division protein ZapB